MVVPDLFVVCNSDGFTKNEYVGVPDLIIEILSPSNQSHDLLTKLNLYMNYGVKEYWIVDPMFNNVMIYSLNEKNEYRLDLTSSDGIAKSIILHDLDAYQYLIKCYYQTRTLRNEYKWLEPTFLITILPMVLKNIGSFT